MTDEKLVEQTRLGNRAAAEELIRRFYPSVLRYCRWRCESTEKAEDLAQETFLRLFRGLPGYEGKGRFRSYLYTIANHVCIDESRRVRLCPIEDERNIIGERNEILAFENREEVGRLLSFLSPEQREAVILRFGEQLSFKEIAEIMGCNMRTAQSRVRNALKIMREEQKDGK